MNVSIKELKKLFFESFGDEKNSNFDNHDNWNDYHSKNVEMLNSNCGKLVTKNDRLNLFLQK